ncbi:MAG: cupredoxin domain-containing protein [Alcanivoracaceae bacterium]|nr:cupredoxin domain-containing protein [Alcanivoracaceae bacterium]
MTNVLVNAAGLAAMMMIVWWFWLWKPSNAANTKAGVIDIRVANGTYSPALIDSPAGQPLTLRVLREDASPCAEYLIVDGLGVNEALPIDRRHDIELPVMQPGEYRFHCQMNMYQGVLRIR